MKKLITLFILCLVSPSIFGEVLEENKIYRLDKTVHDLQRTRDNAAGFIAVQNSKFIVVDNKIDPNNYVVRFITIYENAENCKPESGNICSTVTEDEEYKLAREIGGVNILKSVKPSLGGPVSGPLIVPFKYRLDDRSLTGDATIGYYAGFRTEPRVFWSKYRIPVSPFIAGGLSQINVATNGDTDNRTGVTLAAGILIQNWANVNIGFVYGQDRIGDGTWEHEGEGWVSFMIGWDI